MAMYPVQLWPVLHLGRKKTPTISSRATSSLDASLSVHHHQHDQHGKRVTAIQSSWVDSIHPQYIASSIITPVGRAQQPGERLRGSGCGNGWRLPV